jgi:hypothetical protein
MRDTQHTIQNTDPEALAEIMEVDRTTIGLWRTEEMGAVLRHQLAAPAQAELRCIRTGLDARFAACREVQEGTIRTFGDLFRHPAPPLTLLLLVKDFAKSCRNDPNNPLPDELSTLLYFLSIAFALVHWNERTTSLSERDLRKGLNWAAHREWVESDLQEVLQEALQLLEIAPT